MSTQPPRKKGGEGRQAEPGTTWICHRDTPTGPNAPWFWLTRGSPTMQDMDPMATSAAVSVRHLPHLEMDQNQSDIARDPVLSCIEPGKPLQSSPGRSVLKATWTEHVLAAREGLWNCKTLQSSVWIMALFRALIFSSTFTVDPEELQTKQ